MADQMSKPAGMSRLWRFVLVVSLALNLAVAGVVFGAAASGRWKGGPPPHVDLAVGQIGRALSPQERREARRLLMRDGALRRLDQRAGMAAIVAALQADPFVPEEFRSLLETQATRSADVQRAAQAVLLTVVSDMTPARRAAFAADIADDLSRARPARNQ